MTARPDRVEVHDVEAEREFFEERAGILEFEAGLPREQAEHLARSQTLTRFFGGEARVLLQKATTDGVRVSIVNGELHVSGPDAERERWLPLLCLFHGEITEAL